ARARRPDPARSARQYQCGGTSAAFQVEWLSCFENTDFTLVRRGNEPAKLAFRFADRERFHGGHGNRAAAGEQALFQAVCCPNADHRTPDPAGAHLDTPTTRPEGVFSLSSRRGGEGWGEEA